MIWKNDQVSREETEKILEVARECLGVEGDFVELGCYRGDTALLLAEILASNRGQGSAVQDSAEQGLKRLWIYDSFEGLPEKNREDFSALGENFRKGELLVTKREVKERFLRAGLRVPVIKKGWFRDLTERDLPEKIAFAFLDGDFYESILDSLRLIEGKMGEGGVILVHDFENSALPGVKKAVLEWKQGRNLKITSFRSLAIIRAGIR